MVNLVEVGYCNPYQLYLLTLLQISMSVITIMVDVPKFVQIQQAVIGVDVAMDMPFSLIDVTVKVNNH